MTIGRIGPTLAMAALLGSVALAVPAMAQTTITGGFDVGPGGAQGNFNPLAATAGFTWLSLYYEPLVTWDAGLTTISPALATSWEVSEDQLVHTFRLAEETWHDGEAFDSADVRFTLDLHRAPESGSIYGARLTSVASVEAPDPRTVVVTLSAPDASLHDTLTKIMILPEHALGSVPPAELAASTWWSTTPIGTGPFRFTTYVTDQYVELAADEDYREGRPLVDRVINRYFENPAAAVAALRAGEIQFSYVESSDLAAFEGDDVFRVIEGDSYVVNYLGFNGDSPLWEDVRVRQAVMHAIDRQAIIDSLYGGAAVPANCGYVVGRLVPEGIEAYPYDPERARALLEEAGWAEIAGDEPITFLTYYNTPLAANVMAAIQAMLAQVGIDVVPRAVDTATYNATVTAPEPVVEDFPLVYAGLQNGPDPSALNQGLNEAQIPPAGANMMRVRVPELTAALDAALSETDPAAAGAAYQEVCAVMNRELPWATMWVANRYGVVSSDLGTFTWTPAPGGGPFDADAHLWSLAGE